MVVDKTMNSVIVPHYPEIAVAYRNGLPESIHHGAVVVVDHAGHVIARFGDAQTVTFSRSTCKPLQALALLGHPRFADLGWSSEEVAIVCGSHSGEIRHITLVRSMLDSIACRSDDLLCGVHIPYWYDVQAKCPDPKLRFTPLHHNCSGKHTGMLALCRLLDCTTADYVAADHPVQKLIRTAVAHFVELDESTLGSGTDGCSVPNFAMPLQNLAYAYARLAQSLSLRDPAEYSNDVPELARIALAMQQHPDLVSGTDRFDRRVVQTAARPWISKIGAESIYCLAIPERGWGISIKIADGADRALRVVVAETLRQLQLLPQTAETALRTLANDTIRSVNGAVVGRLVPCFSLRV